MHHEPLPQRSRARSTVCSDGASGSSIAAPAARAASMQSRGARRTGIFRRAGQHTASLCTCPVHIQPRSKHSRIMQPNHAPRPASPYRGVVHYSFVLHPIPSLGQRRTQSSGRLKALPPATAPWPTQTQEGQGPPVPISNGLAIERRASLVTWGHVHKSAPPRACLLEQEAHGGGVRASVPRPPPAAPQQWVQPPAGGTGAGEDRLRPRPRGDRGLQQERCLGGCRTLERLGVWIPSAHGSVGLQKTRQGFVLHEQQGQQGQHPSRSCATQAHTVAC